MQMKYLFTIQNEVITYLNWLKVLNHPVECVAKTFKEKMPNINKCERFKCLIDKGWPLGVMSQRFEFLPKLQSYFFLNKQ